MTQKSRWWKRWLTAPLILIASLVIWVEETLWDCLKWLTAKIALLKWVQRIESLIRQLPPYATVVVFLLPLTILFPFKLLAVYWMTQGHWFASLAVIIAAKVLGTAIEARMFVICKPQLMSIAWFRRLHDWLIQISNRVHAALHALPIYQVIRARLIAIKAVCGQYLNRIKQTLRIIRLWYRRNKAP